MGWGGIYDFGGSVFGKAGVRLEGAMLFDGESRNGFALGKARWLAASGVGDAEGEEFINAGGRAIR